MKSKKTHKMEKEIIVDKNLIAYCGLYCGACPRYIKGKCPGCKKNEKANWCKVRKCGIENKYNSCADCQLMPLNECKSYNNFMSKFFGFIFNSDRAACIARLKETSYESFAKEMAHKKIMTIKKRKKN